MKMFNFNKRQVILNATNACKLYSSDTLLGPANREECIKKMKAMGEIKFDTSGNDSIVRSAVLIPLCIVNNEISLLYTLRSLQLKSHRGQVSFPGGKEDKTDLNLEETALRETEEELGIPRDQIDVWGSGNPIVVRVPPSILPVVGFIKNYDSSQLKLNPAEVEKVFTVPLKDLCNLDNICHTQFSNYSTPVFIGGECRIWGLTAVMTHMFLMCLMSPEAYTYQIKFVSALIKPLRASL